MSDEVRITSPTGGQKGKKRAQLGALHPGALRALAEVAGFGGEKYERYNFLKGYDWSLSFDACTRHLLEFWSGEDFDEESGMPHLAHAAWHCLAMLAFLIEDIGSDDRPDIMNDLREEEEDSLSIGEVILNKYVPEGQIFVINPDTIHLGYDRFDNVTEAPPTTPYENAMYCREFEK